MFWESPRDTEFKEFTKDMEPDSYKRRPEEGTEELDVSDLGIHPELDGPSEEPVNWVITTELNKTKRSTELDKEKDLVPKITPPPLPI
jgi:hypothetical protein